MTNRWRRRRSGAVAAGRTVRERRLQFEILEERQLLAATTILASFYYPTLDQAGAPVQSPLRGAEVKPEGIDAAGNVTQLSPNEGNLTVSYTDDNGSIFLVTDDVTAAMTSIIFLVYEQY